MRTSGMPQIFQQALQKLAAFQTARSLRVAEVGAKIPVCPQYGAWAGLFQSGLPWGGPHVGRQGQPSGCLALFCGWSGFGMGGIRPCGHVGSPLGGDFSVCHGACRSRTLLLVALLLTTLLPGLALTRGLACARLAGGVGGCRARRLLPGGGKGIVAFGHEQGGKPPALPERADGVYERKSHEHSSQATSALLWLGQISSCPVASTTAMELVAAPKPLSVALTRLAASTSAFLP